MTDMRAAIAAARQSGDVNGLVQQIPYLRFLGLQVRLEEGGPVCSLPADPKLVGDARLPALHGGVVGALLESTAIVHLIWSNEDESLPRIIDLSVDYLRSARLAPIHARGIITRLGRRVANVRAEAWQDDPAKPVAAAHAHFLLS